MRKNYQTIDRKSNHKFDIVGGQELPMRVPLPMAEVCAEMHARVEEVPVVRFLGRTRLVFDGSWEPPASPDTIA